MLFILSKFKFYFFRRFAESSDDNAFAVAVHRVRMEFELKYPDLDPAQIAQQTPIAFQDIIMG